METVSLLITGLPDNFYKFFPYWKIKKFLNNYMRIILNGYILLHAYMPVN